MLVLVAVLGMYGCANHLSTVLGSGVVISVGKQNVTLDQFRKMLNDFSTENGLKPGRMAKALVMANIDNVVNTMLLLDEAEREGVTVTTEEINREYDRLKQGYTNEQFNKLFIEKLIDRRSWLRQLEEHLIIRKLIAEHFSGITITRTAIERYYAMHEQDFVVPEMLRACQMEFSSEHAAEQALDALNAGRSFTDVARTYSVDTQAPSGGDMGLLAPGDLPKELEGVLFTLPVGKISGITKTQFGYQIFLVEARIPRHTKSLAEASDDIAALLRRKRANVEFSGWIKALKKKESVHINYELLKRTGLI